jgi:biotin carboxylase
VSTRDHAAIVAAIGDRPLASVVAAASDVSLESWHVLGERYRAPYRYPLAAAVASVDKAAFHAVSAAAGVPSYRYHQESDRNRLAELAPRMGFPLVVKPSDSSGCKGVTLVSHADELAAAFDHAHRYSASGEIIVEEYLAGLNLTLDVFMRNGVPAFTGITAKRIVPGPHFVIGGHTCPAPIDDGLRATLVDMAGRLCLALDLTDGPANIDVVVAPDRTVRVLEANPRLCGNAVPLLMREVYGVDTVAALVSLVLGEPFDVTASAAGAGIIHVLASPLDGEGTLRRVDGLAAVRGLPGVRRCEVFADPGSTVHPFTQSGNKIGYLLVVGPDIAAAEARLATALEALVLDVEPVPAGCWNRTTGLSMIEEGLYGVH